MCNLQLVRLGVKMRGSDEYIHDQMILGISNVELGLLLHCLTGCHRIDHAEVYG